MRRVNSLEKGSGRILRRHTQVAGVPLLLTGSLLYGLVIVAVAVYIPHMHSWITGHRAETARQRIGASLAYVLSLLFILGGLILLALPYVKYIRLNGPDQPPPSDSSKP